MASAAELPLKGAREEKELMYKGGAERWGIRSAPGRPEVETIVSTLELRSLARDHLVNVANVAQTIYVRTCGLLIVPTAANFQ